MAKLALVLRDKKRRKTVEKFKARRAALTFSSVPIQLSVSLLGT